MLSSKWYDQGRVYTNSVLRFQSSNSPSEVLNMFSILKCAWKPNFTFFDFLTIFSEF